MATYWQARHGAGVIRTSLLALGALLACTALLPACAPAYMPIAAAVAGAGAQGAIGHSMNGTAFRTFAAPLAEVKAASLDTLSLMGMKVDGFETLDDGELIRASSSRRTVEIELEPISAKATRMRVAARDNGMFYDSSTATEIVLQTEKAIGVNETAAIGASRRR
jgi:hypothetical protein